MINSNDYGNYTIGQNEIVLSRFGNEGTNISIFIIKSSIIGAAALHKNYQINNSGYNDNSTLNALRSQYGFGDKTAKKQLDSIINGAGYTEHM